MTSHSTFFDSGSRWVRADFHLHTRQDKEFSDGDHDENFVSRYVSSLKKADVQVGVITNHNKFDSDEFRALRKAAKKDDIFLMPGVELSVKDGRNGIHTLVVFHDDWIVNDKNKDFVNDFLGVTFSGQSGFDSSNLRSNHDLIETIRELDKFEKEYFLVFAHVEAANGLWHGLDGGRLRELGENELFRSRTAAFQKVRTRDKREKVKQWLGSWYPSEVEGSDPKNVDEIGRGQSTFVKIGAFTFEAVQFALKPASERLRSDKQRNRTHSWIRSIRFQGGIFDQEHLHFSAEMNCLIGIRGSGKSAILECLRYALDLPMPGPVDETDVAYKQELVRFALASGGKLVIEVEDAEGRLFEVSRILNERADISYNGDSLSADSIPLKNPLFFGQKELVKRGAGSEDELVNRLIGSKLDAVRREIVEQEKRVLVVLNNLDGLESLDAIESEYQNKKKDVEFRLRLFSEHGVEEQLKRQVLFNADVTRSRRTVEAVEGFVRSIEVFLKEQEDELTALARLESTENGDVISDMNVLLEKILDAPTRIREVLQEAGGNVRAMRNRFEELERRRETLKDEFAAVERELSEKLRNNGGVSVRPDDFVRLNAELQKFELALSETAKSRSRRTGLQSELLKEMKRLNDLWHREFREIVHNIKKLNESQTALQIIPEYKGNRPKMLDELKIRLRGSRLRESTLEETLDGHADFISLYQSLSSVCNKLGDSGDVFRRYFDDAKTSLLTWQVPNTYQILYHGKDLRDHSLGQRASALILFILSQRDNDLIIIDQPEDDLDNQTIFEDVIKLIRTLKDRTQFIFATHNANFPVLGDAEQVGACSFIGKTGTVQVGSVDDPGIQQNIVSIMEGGREAFARRKEIYELWKQ